MVIGWRNGGHNVVVVATSRFLPPSASDKGLEVVGALNGGDSGAPGALSFRFSKDTSYPVCVTAETSQLVLYKTPNPSRMQFYSTDPISLGILGWSVPMRVISQEYEQDLVEAQLKKKSLMAKLLLHGGVEFEEDKVEIGEIGEKEKHDTTEGDTSIEVVLSQINTAHKLQRLVHNQGSEDKPSVLYKLVRPLTPIFNRILVYFVMAIRLVCEAALIAIEFRFFGRRGLDLKQVSATAIQLDLRLQQLCYLPVQWMRIRGHDSHTQSPSHIAIERHISASSTAPSARHVPPEYIRMYNTVWLVLNDLILGFALSGFLKDNKEWITYSGPSLARSILVDFPEHTITWLMDTPAGLKLNTELAKFFGQFLLWVINFWSRTMVEGIIVPLLPYAATVGAITSRVGGITLTISVLCDVISLATLHIYAFYIASAKIFHWQLGVITSLFHLFRGRRRNVLRHRIDSCNYDLDQLLMGTIFFTVLLFLLPTVMVFYGAFALARLSIITLSALLETALAFLNHFPLFALLLRAKDRKRLPGGIKFDVAETTGSETPPLELQNVPLGFSKIFYQYSLLSDRIRFHYLSIRVIKRLLTGQFVPVQRNRLYILLYSTLPEQRIDIASLWSLLTNSDDS